MLVLLSTLHLACGATGDGSATDQPVLREGAAGSAGARSAPVAPGPPDPAPPAPVDTPVQPFRVTSPEGVASLQRAQIEIWPAAPVGGDQSDVIAPAVARIEIHSGRIQSPDSGLSLFFNLVPTDLLTTQYWDVPISQPGQGLPPDGTAGAAVTNEEGAGVALASGRLLLERGDGFLRGTVITNTPRGTFTFEGAYQLSCWFLAYPEWPRYAFAKPDPTFETADCAPYAQLQPHQ